MKMTRQRFIDLTGDTPEDTLGDDYDEEMMLDHLLDNDYICRDCLQSADEGACFYCKED